MCRRNDERPTPTWGRPLGGTCGGKGERLVLIWAGRRKDVWREKRKPAPTRSNPRKMGRRNDQWPAPCVGAVRQKDVPWDRRRPVPGMGRPSKGRVAGRANGPPPTWGPSRRGDVQGKRRKARPLRGRPEMMQGGKARPATALDRPRAAEGSFLPDARRPRGMGAGYACWPTPRLGGGPTRHVESGGVLLSHTLPGAVPSALEGLASGFGMRPGVSPPL